ncbi:MAG TPA: metal ABC transporter permease [Devosia sp.]|nr:metal ABC transporter permease [Devosia sp.]
MFSSFMIDTWIAASIVAVVAGIVGFFVVVRGNAFAAHALPLGSFPGAAMAHVLGINDFVGVGLFAALGIAGISQLGRRSRHDVATALSLVTLLGLGALFLSLTTAYSQGVYALLFGQVLGVPAAALPPIAALGAIAVAATLALFHPLLLSAASPELAEASGVSTRLMELLFLVIIGFAAAVAMAVVGALLVFSLMVGPASAARAMTSRPVAAMLLSALLALLTAWASIVLSYLSDWPIGFFVGVFAALWYAWGRLPIWHRTAARSR